MRRFVVAVLALPWITGSCGDAVGPVPAPPLEVARTVDLDPHIMSMPAGLLHSADRFESASIGYAGRPSAYAAAWKSVLAAPDAARQFKHLLTSAPTLPGRLYGLAGLHYTDPPAARAWLSSPPDWIDENVETIFGCIGGAIPVTDLLPQLATGEWIRQWGEADVGPPST